MKARNLLLLSTVLLLAIGVASAAEVGLISVFYPDGKTVKVPMASKTDKGYKVSLSGGAFASGKSDLTIDAKYVLAKLSGMLLVFPDMKLDIGSLTDSTGKAELNLKLSQQRAETVRKFLTEMGVGPQRSMARGYGANQPIAPNDTPEGRSKNRRSDILLTEAR